MDFLNKIDRPKLQRITLIVIAALTLLALVLLLVIIIASIENSGDPVGPTGNDNVGGKDAEKIEFTELEITDDVLYTGSLLLVNSSHYYDIPDSLNLVKIYEYREMHRGDSESTYKLPDSSQRLEATAMAYMHEMLMDLGNATNNHNIMIASAFRTHSDQANFSIPAGYSDSHTGCIAALTVSGGASPYLYDESNAELDNWLKENCYKYGYVVRYPDDKVDITGVEDYSYAYRYVGLPHAKYIYDNALCLEEYIEYLKENTGYKDMLTVKAADGCEYAIYYAACDAGDEVKVPLQTPNPDGSTNFPYTISGTNDGGVIITIKIG